MGRNGRKSTRGRKRKTENIKPKSSKKVKATFSSAPVEKTKQTSHLKNSSYEYEKKSKQMSNLERDFSDESDEYENSMKTLRKNLGVNNRDDSSADESDSIEFKSDSPIIVHSDSLIRNISPADECAEYEVACVSHVDNISQNPKNSLAISSESYLNQMKYSNKVAKETDAKTYSVRTNSPRNSVDLPSKFNLNQLEAKYSNKSVDESNKEDYSDPFVKHLLCEIPPNLLSSIQAHPKIVDEFTENWPLLGVLTVKIPVISNDSMSNMATPSLEERVNYAEGGHIPQIFDMNHTKLVDVHIKPQILNNLISQKNLITLNKNRDESAGIGNIFTPLQNELFSIINNYQDLYYTRRTFKNGEDIRFVYCLHLLNHVLKTRTKVLQHNAKLDESDEISVDYRDQGLVRPKVLVLVPFMESAFKIVSLLETLLLPVNKGNVMNKKRFLEEYTGHGISMPYRNRKPEDFELTFAGNINDDFKIGISVTKKSLKLYSDFYSADIIIASPLGLRRIIGAEGEEDRDYDFLASIEIFILDQADIFLMQNWDHLSHIFKHLHLQPKESHGVDFSRVRLWSLTGKAKFYRQNLIFSSYDSPEISSIFNTRCSNYSGSIKNSTIIRDGTISKVVVQVPHKFHKFSAAGVNDSIGKRFDFFIKNILPSYKDIMLKQVMIFIPDYYDFVKLRNYFRKEVINFTQICDYTKENKVARARDMFYHGNAQFLLYTERFHFFNRIKPKGVQHLVFYRPPYSAHFYSELCNLMEELYVHNSNLYRLNMSVSMIYCKYDFYQLRSVVGSERAYKMIKSDQDTHMIVTGES